MSEVIAPIMLCIALRKFPKIEGYSLLVVKEKVKMDISDRKILVTGGAGFLGSKLCSRLCELDGQVHAVDNLSTGADDLLPEQVNFQNLDIRDTEFIDYVKKVDPDIIIHLAALHYVPYCNEHPKEAFEVNVMGTRRVLSAAREVNLDAAVFASSAAVYAPRDEPNKETSNLEPIDIYGQTKLIGEDEFKLFQEITGTPTTLLRLFNIYGPNETNPHLIPAILDQLEGGSRSVELGNLSPKRDFVHVSDVARAFIVSLKEAEQGFNIYNVGSGEEYSVKEVVGCVEKALGEDIKIEQNEERVRESDRPHLLADINRISTEIGWTPKIGFIEGIRGLITDEYNV